MLEDHKRTGAYYNAVMDNKRLFKDKVVLDVGTGSGILAIFSAMAGAKKVYAVEATDMAKNARKLVEHNKVRDPNDTYLALSSARLRHPQRATALIRYHLPSQALAVAAVVQSPGR
jgi:ribosomal protein L11 methylase PrmA